MKNLVVLFGLAVAFQLAIVSAPRLEKVLRGWLNANEITVVVQVVAIVVMVCVILFAQLSNELPSELFIYGRF